MLYPVELQAQCTFSRAEHPLVGAEGFEPTTSSSQSWRSTRLSYTPIASKPQSAYASRSLEMLRVTLRLVNPYRSTPNFKLIVRHCNGAVLPLQRKCSANTALLKNGAPGEIRTPDHQVRSLVLYPTELRARGKNFCLCRRSAETEGAEARSGIIQTPGTIVNTFFRKISFGCIAVFMQDAAIWACGFVWTSE